MPSAVARRREGYQHAVEMREHRLIADEPEEKGGTDEGPKPTELLAAALASCTAITIEMYADRKEWDLGRVEVNVNFTEASPSEPPKFGVQIKVPTELDEDQRERILVIAGKCPVHRALASKDTVIRDSLSVGVGEG
jgi:putative redox protein